MTRMNHPLLLVLISLSGCLSFNGEHMFPYGFDNGDGEVGAAEGMKNGAAVYYDTSFANPAVKIPFDSGSEIGVPFVSTLEVKFKVQS